MNEGHASHDASVFFAGGSEVASRKYASIGRKAWMPASAGMTSVFTKRDWGNSVKSISRDSLNTLWYLIECLLLLLSFDVKRKRRSKKSLKIYLLIDYFFFRMRPTLQVLFVFFEISCFLPFLIPAWFHSKSIKQNSVILRISEGPPDEQQSVVVAWMKRSEIQGVNIIHQTIIHLINPI
jgi:hypothetical protein